MSEPILSIKLSIQMEPAIADSVEWSTWQPRQLRTDAEWKLLPQDLADVLIAHLSRLEQDWFREWNALINRTLGLSAADNADKSGGENEIAAGATSDNQRPSKDDEK